MTVIVDTRPQVPRCPHWRPGLLLLLVLACGRAPEQGKEQGKATPSPTDTRTKTMPAPAPGRTTPEPVSGAANPEKAATPEPQQNPPGGAPGAAQPPTHNLGDAGDVNKQGAAKSDEHK